MLAHFGSQQLLPLSIRCKQIALQMCYEALNVGGAVLYTKRIFTDVVRDALLPSLLKNSLSQEKQLFILTLNIFIRLTWHFRDRLKSELEQIIENVYFRILDSSNSLFDHKQYTLKVHT